MRRWNEDAPMINFCMLNPSTADEVQNDPTVERCERRAQALDFGGYVVTNIFALRSTDPRALYVDADPIGSGNDDAIIAAARASALVVCAWGAHGELKQRGTAVLSLLLDAGIHPHVLSLTKDGHPAHPLYLPYTLQPRPL